MNTGEVCGYWGGGGGFQKKKPLFSFLGIASLFASSLQKNPFFKIFLTLHFFEKDGA